MTARPAVPGPAFVAALAAVFALALGPVPAAAEAVQPLDVVEGVHSYLLGNGLKVLLVPEPSQPKVTVRILYRVGSRHEGSGETGMAHLLEHMLFKGSSRHRDLLPELSAHGAESNAETDFDSTVYYETLASTPENLHFALDMEADRMTQARLDGAELGREFQVVRNELEIGENDPASVLEQRLLRAAFIWHGYGRDTIGSRSDIEHVPIERLRAFYQKYYQPDNAVLVVAGKLDLAATLRQIVQLFGRLPRPQRRLFPSYTVEPAQDGERLVTVRRAGDVGMVGLAYHAVSAAHADYVAALAAADILSREGSGRLYRALVEKHLATNLRAGVLPTTEPGAVTFLVDIPVGQPIEEVRGRLVATVEGLGAGPIGEAELVRFQRRARKDWNRTSADPVELAASLAHWEAVGDFRLRYLTRDRIEGLTPAAVQSFARRYFLPANRTVGLFLPTAQPQRSPLPESPPVAALLKGYQGRPPPPPGEAFAATIDNIEQRVQRLTLANGMRVLLLPKRSRGETVHLVLQVNAGSPQTLRLPAFGGGGMALVELLGPMLGRGTRRRDFLQLTDDLDRLDADLSLPASGFGLPSLGARLAIETSRPHLAEVLGLLAEMVREPALAQHELDVVRKELVTGLEAELQEPTRLAATAILRRLLPYPADDPRYVPTVRERIARLGRVSAGELQAFHRESWGGGSADLVLVGDFDPAEARQAITGHFASWRAARPYERLHFPYVAVPGGEETLRVPDKQNAVGVVGQTLDVGEQDADYPALLLFGHLLGGADDSRLLLRLREESGASYTVAASVTASAHDRSSYFLAYFTCAKENARPSMATLVREVGALIDKPPSAAELQAAQASFRKQYEAGLSDDETLADRLATHLDRGRTLRFDEELLRRIAALTPTALHEVVRRHIRPDRLIRILAGELSPAPASPPSKP